MSALSRRTGRGRRRCRVLPALLVAGSLLVPVALAAGLSGRPVVDVLEEFRRAGINLIYSSDVVPGELIVTVEPDDGEPREVLGAILAPHGLALRDGPGGSLLVVRTATVVADLVGRVISAEAGFPVLHAVVTVRGTDQAAASRPDGSFVLAGLPVGTVDLEIDAVGFHPRVVPGVAVRDAPTAPLSIVLTPREPFLAELVVTPSRLSILREDQAARLSLAGEDVVLLPTLGGDVSRVIELLPGVAAADNSAAFNVRGGATRDVSFVLDGLELYEPFHLEGLQSPFSLIDAKLVDRVDFLGGGFTAEYGDRHGGIVDMSTALADEPFGTQIEIGTLNSRVAHADTISGGRGGWTVALRSWYPEAVRDTIELGEQGLDPRFADAYLRLSVNASPRTVLSFHALASRDRLDFDENDPDGGSESVAVRNASVYAWSRALSAWSESLVSETVLSLGRIDRERRGISAPDDEPQRVRDERSVDFVGLRHDTMWLTGATSLLKAGLDVRRLSARYDYALVEAPTSDPIRVLRSRPEGTSVGLFVAQRVRLGPRAAAELGLRWDRQTYTNDNQLSPRLNLVWRPRDGTELRLGAGRYFQSQRIHELGIEDGETSFRPAELSEHAALTIQQRLGDGLSLRVDAYHRRLEDLQRRFENLFSPLELFPETEPDRVLVDATSATLAGVELLLRSPPGRPFTWWAGYAWSSADDRIGGRDVPRRWDQEHSLKTLLGYRRDDRWSLSLAGSLHSGWPTTPVTATVIVLPDGTREFEERLGALNSSRYPAYARLDLKASRTITLPRGRLHLELEVVNVTDRRNVCCTDDFEFLERPDGSVRTLPELNRWLGISPSFSVLWEF